MNRDAPPWPGEQPVVFHRTVLWGECDPAGVVYTPRFSDYVVEAFHAFLTKALGGPLERQLAEHDLGTPAKALDFVFRRSLWPEQAFTMTVFGGELRTRSFDLYFEARDTEGNALFDAYFSAVCVRHKVRAAREIPLPLRQRLQAYRDRFPAVPKVRA